MANSSIMLNYSSSLPSSSNTASTTARLVSGGNSRSITSTTSTDPFVVPVIAAENSNNALCSPDEDTAVNSTTSRNNDNSNPTLRSFSAPINGIRNLYPNYYYYSTSRQNSNSSSHSVPNSPLPPKKRMLLRTLQQKQDEDDNNYYEKHADDSSAAARSLLGLSSLLSPRNDDRMRQLVLEEAFLTNSSNSYNKKRNNNNNNGVMMTPVETLQFYSTKRFIHDKKYDPSSPSSTYCCCQCKTTRARDCAYQSVLRVQYYCSDNKNTSNLLYCCHLHAQKLLKKHVSPLNNKNNDNNITLVSCCFIHPEEQESKTTTTTFTSETTSNNKDPSSVLPITRYHPILHSFEESNTTAGYESHRTFVFEEEEDGDDPVTPTTSATTEDLRRFVSSISSSEGLATCNRGICFSSSSSTKDTTPPKKKKKKQKLEEEQQPQQHEEMSPSNSNYNNCCLNELPISLWKDQWVEILTGPFASQKGTVQKWGNGWVTVRMVETATKTSEKEIVYHHRRAFDLQVAAPPSSSWDTLQQREEDETACWKAQGNASKGEPPSLDEVNTSCPCSERATATKMSMLCVSNPQVETQKTCSRPDEQQQQQRKGGSDYKSWTATAAFDRPRRSIVKPQMYDDRYFEEKKRMLREARKANNSDESNSSHE